MSAIEAGWKRSEGEKLGILMMGNVYIQDRATGSSVTEIQL